MKAQAGRELTPAALQRALRSLEDDLGPAEFLARIGSDATADLARAMAEGRVATDLRGFQQVQSFLRQPFGPDATLFAGRPHATGRRLLVAFAGRLHRLMVPTPVFLQRLPAAEWDVLILRDTRQTHFREGCLGLAEGFPALSARIRDIARPYASATALGVSMGALAAVRLALRLDIRAVAIGAGWPQDVQRLFRREGAPPAFEPVCACLPRRSRDLIFVHPADHAEDARAARYFAAESGGLAYGVPGVSVHGVLGALWSDGRLGPFLRTVLDRAATGRALAGLLDEAVAPE